MNAVSPRPRIEITAPGKTLPYQSLRLDSSGGGNLLELILSEDPALSPGTILKGAFSWKDGPPDKFFTCRIAGVQPWRSRFLIQARDSWSTVLTTAAGPSSWRKSPLSLILSDILTASAAAPFDLSGLRDSELERFSIPQGCPAEQAVCMLLKAAKAASGIKQNLITAPDGTLLAGPLEASRPRLIQGVILNSKQQIIRREKNHIEAFALPVLFNQQLIVDGQTRICSRAIISIKPGRARLSLEVL